jgi:sulfide:quinone oxidoreductase
MSTSPRRRLRAVSSRPRVVIAGGGVAAVEAVLALRDLAGRHVGIDMIVPVPVLPHRPSSVATPFGFGGPPTLDLGELAGREGVTLHPTTLVAVDPHARAAKTADGNALTYDFLLLAHGARPVAAIPGATTFAGPADAARVEAVLDAAARGDCRRIAFAVPGDSSWQLPAYELALLMAMELERRGVRHVELTVVTPERSPLWLFGPAAGDAMGGALASRGIGVRTSARPEEFRAAALWLANGEALEADAVIALPALAAAPIDGLPTDEHGFLPSDATGHVSGVDRVFAAGDATAFPVKQGGLAAQQADAAAASIAGALGAIDHPQPFRPVLRGLLLTGGAPLYLRAELSPSGEPQMTGSGERRLDGETSASPLWWPPGKIAGRYLAPYLAEVRTLGVDVRRMKDRVPSDRPDAGATNDAVALALMLAEGDAAAGDYRLALDALEAAAAVRGGVLPEAYVELRRHWRSLLA